MTKEQILEKVHTRLFDEKMYGINCIAKDKVLQAMDDFAQQQLSAERERAGKLVEGINNCIKYLVDKEGMDDGNTIVEMMKQLLD